MKIDWELFVIVVGLVVIIDVPISIYIPDIKGYIMMFCVGLVLTAAFLRWGLKNE